MTDSGFVHLHVHTEHSPLDGLSSPRASVAKIAEDGQTALAITDHGTLSGAWKFAGAARAAGVKPIIGIEAYLAVANEWTSEPDRFAPGQFEVTGDSVDTDVVDGKGPKTKFYQHITLLAATPTGWQNLVAMSNAANDSFKRHPLMDFELMREHSDGIIALTGCLGGPIMGPIARGSYDEARMNLRRLIECFGHDNVYVEIMEHGIAEESAALPALVALAEEFALPLVATNDAHYARAEDATAHEALLAMQSKKTLDDPTRFHFHGAGFHLRTEAEMRALRDEEWWQTACSNTVVVAERCADVVPAPQMRLPHFPLPDGYTNARTYLVELVRAGAIERYGDPLPDEVKARLNYELGVIADAGFIDYFLIVWDLVKSAREAGIRVGPGRGSAAGCAISYCLGIVAVDPLENNLLFERFLEPGRAGMPDIDVDFEKARRGEVLDMLMAKYGADRVARIGSFQAKKSRGVIRGAASVLRLGTLGDQLAKAVPIGDGGQPFSFKKLFDPSEHAAEMFRTRLAAAGEDGERIIALARGMENAVVGESIHACGTLVSDVPLPTLVPLRTDRSASKIAALNSVTQWDGKDIDDYGLLKLDVLGIRNLDIVSLAAKMIADTTGEVIDPDRLPHPNTKGDRRIDAAWELLRSGRTAGVFQMESSGMANLARAVGPETLGDLSAVVALYRPGPMSAGMHEMYADRKNGLQQVDYSIFTRDAAEQDAIAEVLGETYGVFVYQEQLMRLGTVVAGFDVKMRSKLRKAVGKKIPALMAEVGTAFVEGAEQEHYDDAGALISRRFQRATAEKLFEYMKGSADYLFNASHSLAYAQLAFVTAYLKANWPSAYGAAILATTATTANEKRLAALRALREEGIAVLAPDVNRSRAATYPIDDRTVLLGLSEIKDVGKVGAEIVRARGDDRPFTDIASLKRRVIDADGKSALDVQAIEAMIEAGALDSFGPRKGLMAVARANRTEAVAVPEIEWGVLERATRQRQKLGVIMGTHPMDALVDQVERWRTPVVNGAAEHIHGMKPQPLSAIPNEAGATVTVAAVLAEWEERGYSKGQMASFTLESADESVRGVAWNATVKSLHAAGTVPQIGSIVAISGRVDLNTWDSENEDGETVENTSKELMAQALWTVDVDDTVIETEPAEQFPSPLRILSTTPTAVQEPQSSKQPTLIDDVAIDLLDLPQPDTGSQNAPASSAEERPVAIGPCVPVVARVLGHRQKTVVAVGQTEDALRVRDIARGGVGVTFDPPLPARAKQEQVHRMLRDGALIGLLVVVSDREAIDRLPAEAADGFTITTPTPPSSGVQPEAETAVPPVDEQLVAVPGASSIPVSVTQPTTGVPEAADDYDLFLMLNAEEA